MSFLGILKKIGNVALGIEHVAAPVLGGLYPPAAPWLAKLDNVVQLLHGSIIATETNAPADGQGGIKSEAVNADLNAYIDTMNAGLAFANKKIVDDPALRQAAINAVVAGYNATAQWKASFKTVEISAAPPTAPGV